MSNPETNIHVLDSAYKPFPTFAEWASRTTVETARWERYNTSLKARSDLSPDVLRRAREIAKRAAALDTGALEGLYEVDRGFTYTVAFETAAWEVELAKKGESVRPLFDAQLHAYGYVLDLATKAEPITEAAIRVLHEEVCRAQSTYRVMTAVGPQEQPLPKGRYKVLPNHVRTRDGLDHSYAPVDVTPAEMARLVGEMRSVEFLAAHPVIQAAYAHYGLVVIHPFADGNGRVARALASAFTYRAISMPIVILSGHKEAYLDALEGADGGDFQPFVDFMLARTLDTISLVHESVLGGLSPTPEEGAAEINGLFVTRGGFSQDQVDAAGAELNQALIRGLKTAIPTSEHSKLEGIIVPISNTEPNPDSTHRLPLAEEKGFHIQFETPAPAHALLHRQYVLWLPKDAGGDDDIQVVLAASGTEDASYARNAEVAFSARMDEVIPSISDVLQIRIGLFAERLVGEMLNGLKHLAKKALRG
jgi:Fic family protein